MVIWTAQSTSDLSSLFYKKAKIIVGEKVNIIIQDIAIEQTTASEASASSTISRNYSQEGRND